MSEGLIPNGLRRGDNAPVSIPTFPPRVEEIIRRHSAEARLPLRHFLGRINERIVFTHRQACWRELRGITMADGLPPSFSRIGRWFGQRDHTTICVAVNSSRDV